MRARFYNRGLAVAVCSLLTLNAVAQTDVRVVMKTGEQAVFKVEQEGKLYFENENLIIKENANSAVNSTSVENIAKVIFGENATNLTSATSTGNTTVVPTVASSAIHIIGIGNGKANASVYSVSGKLVMSVEVSENQPINVASLPVGIYFVCVNRLTFKIQKI